MKCLPIGVGIAETQQKVRFGGPAGRNTPMQSSLGVRVPFS
ncbi:hypothetical protein RRSWK_01624 [Rhodopirellula sp. SWK7]|nr:hypothetical protein RRSWK_01624 [Rhodopirellula sp. SWK7]